MQYTIDVRTISESNTNEHWAVRRKRRKAQAALTTMATRQALRALPEDHPLKAEDAPINILLRRVATRSLDSDNLPPAMKQIQDSIADVLAPGMRPGMADGLLRFCWDYEQRRGRKGELRKLPDGRMESKVEVEMSIYKIPTNVEYGTGRLFNRPE